MTYTPVNLPGNFKAELATLLGSDDLVIRCKGLPLLSASESEQAGPWNFLIHGPIYDNNGHRHIVTSFTLLQLPGCCGVCLSTGSYVDVNYRRKGIGKLLNRLRIQLARNMGYGLLMCTDVKNNEPQRNILAANGWQDIYEFKNPRTGHQLAVSVFDLTKESQ